VKPTKAKILRTLADMIELIRCVEQVNGRVRDAEARQVIRNLKAARKIVKATDAWRLETLL